MANLCYSDSRDIVENDPAIGFDQNNNTAWLIHTYFVSEPLVKKKPRVQKSGAHGIVVPCKRGKASKEEYMPCAVAPFAVATSEVATRPGRSYILDFFC
jgi:hypothetical protein